jgi:hypothetical protein
LTVLVGDGGLPAETASVLILDPGQESLAASPEVGGKLIAGDVQNGGLSSTSKFGFNASSAYTFGLVNIGLYTKI